MSSEIGFYQQHKRDANGKMKPEGGRDVFDDFLQHYEGIKPEDYEKYEDRT